jgi:hypothetical protein
MAISDIHGDARTYFFVQNVPSVMGRSVGGWRIEAIELILNSTKCKSKPLGLICPLVTLLRRSEASINKIILVIYRPHYVHGSRTGDAKYVIKD